MEMIFSKQIGKHKLTFSAEGKDLFEMVMQSQQISFQDVYKCGLCGSDKLYIRAYETEEDKYQYVKLHCAECRGTLTFGKAKKDGSYFLRKKEDNTLAWEQARQQNPPQAPMKSSWQVGAATPQPTQPQPTKQERFESQKSAAMSNDSELPF